MTLLPFLIFLFLSTFLTCPVHPPEQLLKNYLEWGAQNGLDLFDSRWVMMNDSLQLIATRSIPPETSVFVVPAAFFLGSSKTSPECLEAGGNRYRLIFCEWKNTKSFWKPYFEVLESSLMPLPFNWSDSEIDLLKDTTIYASVLTEKQELKRKWKMFYSEMTWEEFVWVHTVLVTKTWEKKLIPFIELLSYQSFGICNLLPENNLAFSLETVTQIDPGEEVVFHRNYPLNPMLLSQQGSLKSENGGFLLPIYCTDFQLFPQKEKVLAHNNWREPTTYLLGDSVNPDSPVLTIIRFLELREDEFLQYVDQEQVIPAGQLTPLIERRVLIRLKNLVLNLLNTFETTMVEDEIRLKHTESIREQLAINYRISEKQAMYKLMANIEASLRVLKEKLNKPNFKF